MDDLLMSIDIDNADDKALALFYEATSDIIDDFQGFVDEIFYEQEQSDPDTDSVMDLIESATEALSKTEINVESELEVPIGFDYEDDEFDDELSESDYFSLLDSIFINDSEE